MAKRTSKGKETEIPKRATVPKIVDILKAMDQPLSETAIRNHIKKRGLKQSEKDKTYSVPAVLRAITKHQKEDNRTKGGELGDQLKRLQIRKVELEIARLEGSVIPIDEHNQEIMELMSLSAAVYDHFLSSVEAVLKDPKCSEIAERLCNSARENFMQRIKEEES